MKYRLFLWDFDGTLADTLPGLLRIYNRLAEERGYAVVEDPAAVREMTMRQFLAAHRIPLTQVPGLVRAIAAAQKSEIGQVRLHESLPALVRRLHQAGCKQGIV